MADHYYIYKYVKPNDTEPFYIGKTVDMERRVMEHSRWDGREFKDYDIYYMELPNSNDAEMKYIETYLIDKFKPVKNIADKHPQGCNYELIGLPEWRPYTRTAKEVEVKTPKRIPGEDPGSVPFPEYMKIMVTAKFLRIVASVVEQGQYQFMNRPRWGRIYYGIGICVDVDPFVSKYVTTRLFEDIGDSEKEMDKYYHIVDKNLKCKTRWYVWPPQKYFKDNLSGVEMAKRIREDANEIEAKLQKFSCVQFITHHRDSLNYKPENMKKITNFLEEDVLKYKGRKINNKIYPGFWARMSKYNLEEKTNGKEETASGS